MSLYLKISAYLATVIAGYTLRTYLTKRFLEDETDVDHEMALFFPETGIALKDRHKDYNTLISLYPNTSLAKMLSVLKTSRRSLDICLFGFSFETMISLIEDLAHHQRVGVRIIIHRESDESVFAKESAITQSTIDRLKETLKFGTELKIVGLADDRLLHHKFAVIDDRILVNGSFNWSENSIFNSFNDCVITCDPKLIIAFKREFSRLWFNDSF